MSQPEHVKDPSVEFAKSRLLGAAAEAKFVRDPKNVPSCGHFLLN
jgi:hypothetical protein